MSNKIKVYRGLEATIPTLDEGELGYTTDSKKVFIGTDDGNKEIGANGGGGDGIDLNTLGYMNYAADIFYRGRHQSLFSNAWQDMKNSETVLFDIPLMLAAPNQEMGGMTIDLYVGTNGQLQALYDACVNETIRPPIADDEIFIPINAYYVNNVATVYMGDIGGSVGFPIPLYGFGLFGADDNTSFIIGDLTPLEMGLGLVLAKIVDVPIPNNNIVIQQGFKIEDENGIIIPNSVTSIEERAFGNWGGNNQPLVIPDSVTSIGDDAFAYWTSNNQPLVIPNSVTSIEERAFSDWHANNQPLVIPDSVTSIGERAFSEWSSNNKQLVIPNSVTSIGDYAFAFWASNNQSLVIPNSITIIGERAFGGWTSNNQPLIIPNSITSIGDYAFNSWNSNNQPLVIPNSVTSMGNNAFGYWNEATAFILKPTTPPSIVNLTFSGTNNALFYVPDESVDDYKTATNWVNLEDRIFSINDK